MIARLLVWAIWVGALAMIALTAGCASMKGTFENRIAVTLTCDRAFVNSLYGWLGISSELSEKDAAILRAARCSEQRSATPSAR